jgi:DNA-directed RNA polymerase subunit M/transcription elongation factor TFIIS
VFVGMSEADLRNPEAAQALQALKTERARHRNLVELRKAQANPTAIFKCQKCGGREMDFEQKQTRGGDEPMTITLTCLLCDHVERGCDISSDV